MNGQTGDTGKESWLAIYIRYRISSVRTSVRINETEYRHTGVRSSRAEGDVLDAPAVAPHGRD